MADLARQPKNNYNMTDNLGGIGGMGQGGGAMGVGGGGVRNNTKTLECTGKAEKQSVYFVIVRVGSRKSMFLTFKSQPCKEA